MSKETRSSETDDMDGQELSAFEGELRKLEEAVDRLESGDLTLEEAFRQWEEGSGGFQRCRSILSAAKARIEILSRGMSEAGEAEAAEGDARWGAFEVEGESDSARPTRGGADNGSE